MNSQATSPEQYSERGTYQWHRYIYVCQWLAQQTGEKLGRVMLGSHKIELTTSDLVPGTHYVIAANHQTYLDPWMVLSRIPLSIWRQIGFPRALVANRFFDYPIVSAYLKSMGSFPAKPHRADPYGLEYASHLLERGQSIVIFPEGHISLHRQHGARRGVEELAHGEHVAIIPMHFEWLRPRWKARFDLGIGKPFDAHTMSAQEILDRIYATPVR